MKPTKAKAVRRLKIAHALIEFEDGPPGFLDAMEVSRQLSRGYGVGLGDNYNRLIEPKRVETESGSATLYATTTDETVREIAEEYERRLAAGDLRNGEVFWKKPL